MVTKISNVSGDDKTKIKVTLPKSDKEVAKQNNYITNTRLLLLFNTDSNKDNISKKELANLEKMQKEYYAYLYDDNGKKVRYVEQLDDNNNYLVYEYENGKITSRSILNVATGEEQISLPTYDENGEENGYNLYTNGVPSEGKQVIFDNNNRPVKIIEKQLIYDANGKLISVKEEITEYEYNKDGSVKNIKFTVNKKTPDKNPDKKLDVNT